MNQIVTETIGLDRIIEAVEQAALGSRVLDLMIANLVRPGSFRMNRMIRTLVDEGYSWNLIGEIFDEEMPAFTGSLDARLPGENIVFVMHSAKRGRWAALHRDEQGREVLAWAATEALARRLAALKAMQGGAAEAGEGASPSAVPATPPAAPEDGEPAAGEWKIRF
jgi:hypothetical protein